MAQKRRKLDQYFTDERLFHQLERRVHLAGDFVEPCNGKGALTNCMHNPNSFVESVVTNDVDPKLYDWNLSCQDATKPSAFIWSENYYDGCVTNPPFSIADQILKVAWEHCDLVALLLRLSFLEPTKKRAPLLKRLKPYMTHLIILGQPRPSFTGNGSTDSVTTAWMVWQHGYSHELDISFVTNWADD